MSCSICLEKFTNPSCIVDGTGTCGHLFCKSCIDKIPKNRRGGGFTRSTISCPTCRKTYYDPLVNAIYIEEGQTIKKSIGDFLMQNASYILDQEAKIAANVEKIEATKQEHAKEIATFEKFKEDSAKERDFIKVGEGKLFKKKFRELRKPFDRKLEEAQQKAEQECDEIIKQTHENADRVTKEIQKQIEDQIAIKKKLFEQIAMEIERMNQEYYEYKVFCKTAKQYFINYYPIIVQELFRAIEFIKTLKGSLTEKERKEITKIMRKIKTLDIGLFVKYANEGPVFKSSEISVTELHEMESMLRQEIQIVKKIPVSTWKETRW